MNDRPRIKLIVIIAAASLAALALFVGIEWPFTRGKVTASLAENFGSQVRIRSFRRTFWPHPGCIALGVTIYRGDDTASPPLLTVDKLTVIGDYPRLLTFSRTLNRVHADGLRILIPRKAYPRHAGKDSGNAVIERFEATRSSLAFEPEDPKAEPFTIQMRRVELSPASARSVIGFRAALAIPEPPGEILAGGRFGPWAQSNPYRTPVAGNYLFQDADLGRFEGLGGILHSTGHFNGTVERIAVSGQTQTPNFEIESASHALPVAASFRATMNGRTGDVALERVEARVLETRIVATGSVAGRSPGAGKTVALDLNVNGGRIQDLLRLVNSGPPKLSGQVNLRFRVTAPPGNARFLERVQMTGQMGVGDARFINGHTQEKLEHISRNAASGEEDPAEVLSDLKGSIAVSNGVASLTNVKFKVPGASADLKGTYRLLSKSVDLRGTVYLNEKLSKATTGVKSLLLKALDPFFKKRKRLSVVPVRITGKYGDTSIGLDL